MTKTFKALSAGAILALAGSGATLTSASATTAVINLANQATQPSSSSTTRVINLAKKHAMRASSSFGVLPARDMFDNGRAPSLAGPLPVANETITVRDTPYRAASVPDRTEVSALQKALNQDGSGLRVNGVLDQRTMTALLNYQSDHGLAITGTLDSTTRKVLGIA